MNIKKFFILGLAVTSLVVVSKGVQIAINADVQRLSADAAPKVELIAATTNHLTKQGEDTCVPTTNPEAELIGEEQGDRGTYRLWVYQVPTSGRINQQVTIDFGEACGTAYDQRFDEAVTNRIPLETARSLTLQLFQNRVEIAGGIEAYRDIFLASFNEAEDSSSHPYLPNEEDREEKLVLTSVELWALNELGIVPPAGSYDTRDIDEAWEYDYDL